MHISSQASVCLRWLGSQVWRWSRRGSWEWKPVWSWSHCHTEASSDRTCWRGACCCDVAGVDVMWRIITSCCDYPSGITLWLWAWRWIFWAVLGQLVSGRRCCTGSSSWRRSCATPHTTCTPSPPSWKRWSCRRYLLHWIQALVKNLTNRYHNTSPVDWLH